jgi:hypothetical protein
MVKEKKFPVLWRFANAGGRFSAQRVPSDRKSMSQEGSWGQIGYLTCRMSPQRNSALLLHCSALKAGSKAVEAQTDGDEIVGCEISVLQ